MMGHDLSRWCRAGGAWAALMVLAASTGATGCTGSIGDAGDGSGPGPTAQGAAVGAPDFRRLSPLEIEQTIDDVFADFGVPDAAEDLLLAPPDVRYTFSNTAESGNFTTGQIQNIMAWAESVSLVFSDNFDTALDCTPTPSWDDCASGFATRLGRLTFRRPLDAEDLAIFQAVYEDVTLQAEDPARDGFRAIVELALVSPEFWYLSNQTQPDTQRLTAHAIAGRLSYYLWGTMPDAELRAAADQGDLQTPEQIRAQAVRLLDDPRAEAIITRFHREWLHLSPATSLAKDAELYPSFDPDLAADMDAEFDRYVQRHVSEGNVADLLSSRESAVNTRMESLYGLESTSAGPEDWVWRELGDERSGILTRPLFLANTAGLGESALIHRGVAVIEDYFCKSLVVPDDVSDEAVDVPPEASSGKLAGVENRAAKPRCSGCHDTIDPIGVSFEVFDAIGGFRTEYPDGVSIAPAGEIAGGLIVEENVPYQTSAELMSQLAARPDVQSCYASKWIEWSTGRAPTRDQRQEVERLAAQGRVSIRSLLLEVATSPLLTHREDF